MTGVGGEDPNAKPTGTTPGKHGSWGRTTLHPLLWAAGLALPIGALSYITGLGLAFSPVVGVGAILYALGVQRSGLGPSRWFAPVLVAASAVLAVASFLTGRYNGLTDEPYVMPQLVGPLLHGIDPYTVVRTYTYQQYGTTLSVRTGFVYLPLYLVLQPFVVPYKVFALAAWGASVALVWRRPFARVALGQPFVALLAANGFNDFPVLLLLTLAYVGVGSQRSWWAEALALGCKQFANAFVIGYHLLRRDFRRALIAVGITVVIVLPFVLWNPSAFACETLPLTPHSCGSASTADFYAHTNYYLWPLWGLALFYVPIAAWSRRSWARVRTAAAPSPDGPEVSSSPGSVGAPPESARRPDDRVSP